jgi:hypothetical protein
MYIIGELQTTQPVPPVDYRTTQSFSSLLGIYG